MSSGRNIILGLFFVAAFAVLGYYTIFLTDFQVFGERVTKTVYFSETNGLRQGDSVLVAGVRWGKVESLEFDPQAERERRITVVISLDEPVALHADHRILIKDATLLGGKNLVIDPGLPNSPTIPEDRELYGTVSTNVLEALDDLVAENRAAIRTTLSDIQTIVADVREGRGVVGRLVADEELALSVSSAISSIAVSFENVDALTTGLRSGEGSLGRLFTEDALYNSINTTFERGRDLLGDARTVLADIRQGRGTVGRALYDETMAEDFASGVHSIRSIADTIDAGGGTVGRLVRDEELADGVSRFVTQLTAEDSTVGQLLASSELYDNFNAVGSNLSMVLQRVASGEGTVGRLLMDDEIYDQLRQAVATLTGSLEEAREAAPISTFLGTVFLGF